MDHELFIFYLLERLGKKSPSIKVEDTSLSDLSKREIN